MTPFGNLCLGLTPLLRVFPVGLNGSGQGSIGGTLPADASLSGATLYWSALGFDPSQPMGIALSNGASFTFRQPRLHFVHPGVQTPFGTTPGAIAALDLLTESVPFSQPLATNVRDSAFVTERNWLVALLGNNDLVAYDGGNGTQVLKDGTHTGARPGRAVRGPGWKAAARY